MTSPKAWSTKSSKTNNYPYTPVLKPRAPPSSPTKLKPRAPPSSPTIKSSLIKLKEHNNCCCLISFRKESKTKSKTKSKHSLLTKGRAL